MNQIRPIQTDTFSSQRFELQAKEALSPTDEKVNCLVIWGHVLIGLSIITGTLSLVFTFTLSPWWALGIIASVAFGALGIQYIRSTIEQIDTPPQEFIPHQPMGIRNSTGALCWMGSSFHCFDLPSFRALIEKNAENEHLQPLVEEVNTYIKEQDDSAAGQPVRYVSKVNTLKLCHWLHDKLYSKKFKQQAITSREGTKQEDAVEFFRFFLDTCTKGLPYKTKTIYPDKVEEDIGKVTDPLIALEIQDDLKFENLWNHFFKDDPVINDFNQEVQNMKEFTEAPQDFTLQLKRFKQAGWDKEKNKAIDPRKINDLIEVPFSITLSQEQCPSNQATYVCDYVVLHNGSLSSGHYRALVHKDEKWFLLNDSRFPEVVDEKRAMNLAHENGYIFHFTQSPS